MAIHEIEAPDGKIHEIDAPDGATPEQVMSFFQANYKPEPAPEKGYFEGLADAGGAAITNRGLGLMQTAQDVGLPVNKLFGVTPEKFSEASQRAVAGQNKLAEDTGVSGAIVGELADPLNLVPMGKLGKLALPAYGAASGFTGGKSDDDGLGGRVRDAGVDSAVNYAGGKALEVGAKLATPVVRKAAEYIPDAVTNRVTGAANYVADKLKPTAAGPTIDNIKENIRYGAIPKMSAQEFGEAAIKQKGDTTKTVSEFYNIARDLGNDILLATEPFANKAQSLLDSLPQDTFGTDKGAKIKEALTRFSQDKTVSAADLIDMEKNINKYWNRNADGKYDSLFELKDLIQQKLDSVSGDGTDLFKTAYNNAKQSHKDLNVARFGDNKIVNQLLPEHDFENLADFNRRKLTNNPSEIPDDTMQKLNQFVDKVRTPEEVNAALKIIPPEQREAFVKMALAQKMSKTRSRELITALKNTPWIVTSDWRRPVGAAVRVINPSLDDAGALSALKKIKKEGFTDTTFDKYQKELAKLNKGVVAKKASDQQLKDLAGEMQPFNYAKPAPPPPKPLALPSPAKAEPEYVKDVMGRQRLMTDEEKIAANAARKAQGTDVNTPRENARIRNLDKKTYEAENPESNFFNREKPTPLVDSKRQDFNFGSTPEGRAANDAVKKMQLSKEWDKINAEQQNQILSQMEADWAANKTPAKKMIRDALAKAQSISEAKGEKFNPTSIGQALKDAGYAKGGSVKSTNKNLDDYYRAKSTRK